MGHAVPHPGAHTDRTALAHTNGHGHSDHAALAHTNGHGDLHANSHP